MEILPDLWDRLAALSASCEVWSINRPTAEPGEPWIVRVSRRAVTTEDPIEIEAASLPEALSAAIERAEASGWVSKTSGR